MHNDVLEYQGKGAQILICGDYNARTAEEPDFLRMADLQPVLPTMMDEDELPDYIRQRRNKDLLAPGSQTWGPKPLGFCQQADLLILNGRTLGDECGHFTIKNTKGCCSTVDHFVASAECFSAVSPLHVSDEAARYNSDHNPLLLHIAYKAPCDTHTHTSSAASDARIRYDVQKAEAYQACLATELQQHFVPLIQQELNVDVLCDRLEACMSCSAKHYAASL